MVGSGPSRHSGDGAAVLQVDQPLATGGRPGGIRFLFDCGKVSDKALADLLLQPEEISESRLALLPDALALLRGPIRRRVRAATRGQRLVYLEDGRLVSGVPEGF